MSPVWSKVLAGAMAVAVAAASGTAFAQVTTAAIRGSVKDTSGGVLPGVSVNVTHMDTGFVRTVTSDAAGHFDVQSLAPGRYRIAAELSGFRRYVRSDVGLSVGQNVTLAVSMEMGQLAEEVIVTGEVPLVDTSSGALSGLVQGETVRTLPLNGRSFDQLALLNPGVTAYVAGGQNVQNGPGVKMSISGARPESVYFMLDGTNILDHSNFTPGSAAGNNLGVDGIQEFRVFSHNYSAELGVRAGGAVSVITRSGSNDFHGSLFGFHRNDSLDSPNFFDTAGMPEFERNQFGFSLGGPIVRQKAFFFMNLEWLRETLGRTLIAVVPTAAARQGILPTFQVNVNPVVRPYLDLYPLPNGRDFGDGTAEFVDTFSQPTNENYRLLRVDFNLTKRDTLFVRYTSDDATITSPQENLARFVNLLRSKSQFFTIQETHIFSQRLLNEFRFALNQTQPEEAAEARPGLDPALRFFDHAPTVGQLTFSAGRGSTDGAAISSVGVGGNAPRVFEQEIYQFSDTMTYQRGRHALKFGADLQFIRINGLLNEDTNGQFSFSGFVNLLRGQPASMLAPAPGSDNNRKFRQTLFGSFIQDDFRIKDNLTVNLGLRHEFITMPNEADGKVSNLVNVTDPAPTIGFVYHRNNSLKNFGPRVGFAWDPWKAGKTSIRGGAGVFYSQVMGRNFYPYLLRQTPFSFFATDVNPPFPNPFVNGVKSNLQQNDRLDPDMKTPTMYHYNLTFQRQLGQSMVAEVGYVGSRGVNLLRNYEANTRVPEVQSDGRLFFPAGAPPINPNFGPIFTVTSDAHSWYDSLQTRLARRSANGLSFQLSYTWAKSIDEASHLQRGQGRNTPSFTQNPFDPSADKGLSSFHVAHAFSAHFSYDVPRFNGLTGVLLSGWQLGGIARFQTGNPFTAETGFNRSRDGNLAGLADRPNIRPGADPNPVLGGADRYFDPNVFELPPPGYYGNVGRNTIIGPGFQVVDVMLGRDFPVRGRVRLAVRGEVFNVFDHVNLGLPRNRIFNAQGTIPGSTGRISATASSARQGQLGLKVTF